MWLVGHLRYLLFILFYRKWCCKKLLVQDTYCFHAWDTTLAALVHVNFPLVEKVVINFAVVVKQEMTT
jgi:hypothetical protein